MNNVDKNLSLFGDVNQELRHQDQDLYNKDKYIMTRTFSKHDYFTLLYLVGLIYISRNDNVMTNINKNAHTTTEVLHSLLSNTSQNILATCARQSRLQHCRPLLQSR